MRKCLFFLLLFLGTVQALGQQSVNIGLGYGERLNYRLSGLTGVFSITANYTRPLQNNILLRLTTGLEGTDPGYDTYNISYNSLDDYFVVPVRGGVQYRLGPSAAFLMAESGVGFGFFPFAEKGDGLLRVNLSYAAGGGYNLTLNERRYLQGSISLNRNHYDHNLRFTWLLLRVAYGWNSKK